MWSLPHQDRGTHYVTGLTPHGNERRASTHFIPELEAVRSTGETVHELRLMKYKFNLAIVASNVSAAKSYLDLAQKAVATEGSVSIDWSEFPYGLALFGTRNFVPRPNLLHGCFPRDPHVPGALDCHTDAPITFLKLEKSHFCMSP